MFFVSNLFRNSGSLRRNFPNVEANSAWLVTRTKRILRIPTRLPSGCEEWKDSNEWWLINWFANDIERYFTSIFQLFKEEEKENDDELEDEEEEEEEEEGTNEAEGETIFNVEILSLLLTLASWEELVFVTALDEFFWFEIKIVKRGKKCWEKSNKNIEKPWIILREILRE